MTCFCAPHVPMIGGEAAFVGLLGLAFFATCGLVFDHRLRAEVAGWFPGWLP